MNYQKYIVEPQFQPNLAQSIWMKFEIMFVHTSIMIPTSTLSLKISMQTKRRKPSDQPTKKYLTPPLTTKLVRTCKKYIELCPFEGARKVFVYWNYLYICLLLNFQIENISFIWRRHHSWRWNLGIVVYDWHLRLWTKGSLSCLTYCDTWSFLRIHPKICPNLFVFHDKQMIIF